MKSSGLALFAMIALASGAAQRSLAGEQFVAGFSVVSSSKLVMSPLDLPAKVWELRRDSDGSSIKLVAILAPQSSTSMSIKPTLMHGRASELFQPSLCKSAIAITNGSFYLATGNGSKPLGLVRVDGKTLGQPSKRKSGGFLTISAGKPAILKRGKIAAAMASEDAIESTPILIEAGASGMKSDDQIRFDRVAIGNTMSGFSILIGAFGEDQNSVSLFEFEKLVRAAVTSLGESPSDVIALDGGPSAHIYLPATGQLFGYAGAAYLPNIVCLGTK